MLQSERQNSLLLLALLRGRDLSFEQHGMPMSSGCRRAGGSVAVPGTDKTAGRSHWEVEACWKREVNSPPPHNSSHD